MCLGLFIDRCNTLQLPARRWIKNGRLKTQSTISMTSPDVKIFKLYNTMTRKKDVFAPMAPPKVSFYSCGPTVYDFAHIGNFRAFLTYDILKRWLLCLGYDVEHICNLTDIDDKIIARMSRDKITLADLTEK